MKRLKFKNGDVLRISDKKSEYVHDRVFKDFDTFVVNSVIYQTKDIHWIL